MRTFILLFLALCLVKLVFSNAINGEGETLKNKHLTIQGEYWNPFLTYDIYENGRTANYRGIMWDLLLFMQRARNFTFTMVSEAEYIWGKCYDVDNCTGIIGNRKEVDFALGNYHSEVQNSVL